MGWGKRFRGTGGGREPARRIPGGSDRRRDYKMNPLVVGDDDLDRRGVTHRQIHGLEGLRQGKLVGDQRGYINFFGSGSAPGPFQIPLGSVLADNFQLSDNYPTDIDGDFIRRYVLPATIRPLGG